jgi:phosphoribosylformylglycinamidine cyclo-ligase
MTRVFNCGIGMVIVVDEDAAGEATKILSDAGERVFNIGRVMARSDSMAGCVVAGLDRAWG